MSTPRANDAERQAAPTPRFASVFSKTWRVAWGVAGPSLFLLAALAFKDVDWQSGRLRDYAVLVYGWPHALFLYPLVMFSTAGYVHAAFSSEGSDLPAWAWYGLLGGVALWIELWVAWCLAMSLEGAVVVTLVSPVLGAFVVLPFAAIADGLSTDAEPPHWAGAIAFLVLFATLFIWPVWVFALVPAAPLAVFTYVMVGWERLQKLEPKDRRLSLRGLMLAFAWVSANFAAWRLAIQSMLAEYATLPTEPPGGCFIATAAARGHRDFVGADDRGVTRQLRTLKAGELLLRHATPRLHRRLRWVYNRLGPRAARLLATRWLADLAYLGLKPFEWFARGLLRLADVNPQKVDALYRFK